MKIIKRLLILLLAFLLCGSAVLGVAGFMEYKKAINKESIDEKVSKIRADEHYVTYDQISPMLLKATVAIEDKRFYDHGGVDVIGLGRALLDNMMAKKVVGGGSTITQQLAKNMYFGYEPSLTRKVGEFFLTHDLEGKYSKKEILELYVNIINYGDNHIGIWEASHGYYQVEPSQLSLTQASMLAGIPQSPSNFQLSNHLDSARYRQKAVLAAMADQEIISDNQAKEAEDK